MELILEENKVNEFEGKTILCNKSRIRGRHIVIWTIRTIFALFVDCFGGKRVGLMPTHVKSVQILRPHVIRTRSIKINGGLTGKLSQVHQGIARSDERSEITHKEHHKAAKSKPSKHTCMYMRVYA